MCLHFWVITVGIQLSNQHIMLRLQQSRVRISTSCYKLNTCIKFKNPGLRNNYSVVDPDKYWIRIQKPSGSGSVFGIRIRIHTCKYRIKCRQKIKDKKYKFTVPRLNRVKICSGNILFLLYSIKKNCKRKQFFSKIIFNFLSKWIVHITLDPGPDLDPDPNSMYLDPQHWK